MIFFFMKYRLQYFGLTILAMIFFSESFAQKKEMVQVVKSAKENKIDVFIGDKLFTSFLYPDSLEKPVLYPVHAANGTIVTRGFPLDTQPNDPTDHPASYRDMVQFRKCKRAGLLE